MADEKKPDETKDDPTPAAPPEGDGESEVSDQTLDEVAGGLAQLRFSSPRLRPFTST